MVNFNWDFWRPVIICSGAAYMSHYLHTATITPETCLHSVAPLSAFCLCQKNVFPFFIHNQRGNYLLSGKRGSPLILDWLDWAWRPKGSNPHPLKTRDANSNHNTANICFALPKRWFETCWQRGSGAAAAAAKDHSFLWHVLWVLAHHVYIYRARVVTHVHGLLVLS